MSGSCEAQLELARDYLRSIGRAGGSSTSPAKQAAVRVNGRGGGEMKGRNAETRRNGYTVSRLVAFRINDAEGLVDDVQEMPVGGSHTTEDGIYVYDLSR